MSAGRRAPRGPGWTLIIVSAALIGLAAAAAVPLEYRAAARFRIPVGKSLTDADWSADLWRAALAAADTGGFRPDRMSIEQPELGRRTFWVASTDRAGALKFARRVSTEFEAVIARRAAELRTTPASHEQLLSQQGEKLREQIAAAERTADQAVGALPRSDPRVNREALLARWNALRTDWSASRETLAQSLAETERLKAQPEPSAGMVSADERRTAMEADVPLQQDIRELTVRLSELRLHLLKVWQSSAGRLEQLTQAADAACQAASAADITKVPANLAAAINAFSQELDSLRGLLASFSESWTAEFTALQRSEIDALAADVLEVNERVRKSLHDFLFASSQKLSAARTQLKAFGGDPAVSARHHVLHSDLTRAFQALQTARHRFEFAAGTIDTPENFRLDASLRAARGLRRRTQERTESIEKRLADEAVQRARRQQQQALAAAAQAVESVRNATAETAEKLFELQEGLLSAGQMTEEFVAGLLRAEVAAQRVQTLRNDLAALQATIAEEQSRRLAAADALKVELLSCDVAGYDLRPRHRFQVGIVVTLVAFVLTALLAPRRRT